MKTYCEKLSAPHPCPCGRHFLTGGEHPPLVCPHGRQTWPVGRWGARWAQPDTDEGVE
jgi:hypothetical protein